MRVSNSHGFYLRFYVPMIVGRTFKRHVSCGVFHPYNIRNKNKERVVKRFSNFLNHWNFIIGDFIKAHGNSDYWKYQQGVWRYVEEDRSWGKKGKKNRAFYSIQTYWDFELSTNYIWLFCIERVTNNCLSTFLCEIMNWKLIRVAMDNLTRFLK